MKTTTLILTMLVAAAIGLIAPIVLLAFFTGAKTNLDIGTLEALGLASSMAVALVFLYVMWHNIGKPASWKWLKAGVTYHVVCRYDVIYELKGRRVVSTHLGIMTNNGPRMYNFNYPMRQEIVAGSMLEIYESEKQPQRPKEVFCFYRPKPAF